MWRTPVGPSDTGRRCLSTATAQPWHCLSAIYYHSISSSKLQPKPSHISSATMVIVIIG